MDKMFCYQCEEAMNCSGCTEKGMCGKEPEIAKLQDKLIYSVKKIAKEGKTGEEADKFIMESLFSTVTNVNFDAAYFKKKIEEAKSYADLADEDLDNNSGVLKEENDDIRSLKELLTYGIKGLAAYLHHAFVLGYKDQAIFDFTREALAALLDESDADKLTGLVLKCGEFGVKTMALLDSAHTETYGKPQPVKVSIAVGTNPGILISGHDMKDMKDLLEQTQGTGVDVYTHGEMLPAHAYPELKKFKHLVGNYGGSWWKQGEEFEKFNGPILMTTNCIIPPRDSYKDRVYTTGVAGYEGIKHIPDREDGKSKDFSAIINHAKKCAAPVSLEKGSIMTGFAHDAVLGIADKIVDAVKSGAIKHFVVMAGCDGRHKDRDYYTKFAKALPKDAVILTAGCAKYRYNKLDLGDIGGIPRVIDAGQCNDCYSLAVIAMKLAEAFGLDNINKLPVSYNVAWYEQKAVLVLLALLHLGVKNIRLGPKLPAFVSPGVLNVLVEKFGIGGITNVEDDMKALLPS